MNIRLRDAEVLVRPFEERDAEAFALAARESAESVGLWMPWCHESYSAAEAREWIAFCAGNLQMKRSYDLGIFSAADDNLLYGGISINQINPKHKFGVVGYWVRASCQRRGIATRAVRLIADYGFTTLELSRLEIVIAEANLASQGVAEKANAVYEGIARNRLVIRQHAINAVVFSLVPSDVALGAGSR